MSKDYQKNGADTTSLTVPKQFDVAMGGAADMRAGLIKGVLLT